MSDPRLADELRATTYRFARRLNATAAPGELPAGHRAVLAALDVSGPMTAADIARHEHVTPQAVSLAVTALAADGMLQRGPDPTDRRRRVLSLTERGRGAIHVVRDEKNAWIDARIATLTDDERATLRAALALMRRLVDTP